MFPSSEISSGQVTVRSIGLYERSVLNGLGVKQVTSCLNNIDHSWLWHSSGVGVAFAVGEEVWGGTKELAYLLDAESICANHTLWGMWHQLSHLGLTVFGNKCIHFLININIWVYFSVPLSPHIVPNLMSDLIWSVLPPLGVVFTDHYVTAAMSRRHGLDTDCSSLFTSLFNFPSSSTGLWAEMQIEELHQCLGISIPTGNNMSLCGDWTSAFTPCLFPLYQKLLYQIIWGSP